MKITLELDREQLDILMCNFESYFSDHTRVRCAATLDAEIEDIAVSWTPGDDSGFEFVVMRLAPVYRQLLMAWGNERPTIGGVYETSSVFEFIEAVRAARIGGHHET